MAATFVRRCAHYARGVVSTLWVLVLAPAGAHTQEKESKEAIVKVWKERQEQVKSASFEWTEEETQVAGSLSAGPKKGDPKAVIPPKDTTFSGPRAACFDGNKLRYEYKSMLWCDATNAYAPSTYLSVFNGTTCAMLHGPSPEREFHNGLIRKDNHHVDGRNLHLQPMLMTFRALTPSMRTYEITNFEMKGIKTKIGEHTCQELGEGIAGGLENRLWVDPARGFVVVRCMTLNKGKVVHQLDVRYKLGPEKVWLPDNWSIVFNQQNGKLASSFQARLTHYELNGSIAKEQFEMQFPPGTYVTDYKNDLEWIVKPSGLGKRMVAKSEGGLSYEQLVGGERGAGDGDPPRASTNWLALGGVGVALTALALVILKYRRKLVLRRKT